MDNILFSLYVIHVVLHLHIHTSLMRSISLVSHIVGRPLDNQLQTLDVHHSDVVADETHH